MHFVFYRDKNTGVFFVHDKIAKRNFSIAELEAAYWLIKAEKQGYPKASEFIETYNLREVEEGVAELEKTAKEGCIKAMTVLYLMHEQVEAYDKIEELHEMMEKTAKEGCSEAMFILGTVYARRSEIDKASYWFIEAEKQGHPKASEFVETYKLKKVSE